LSCQQEKIVVTAAINNSKQTKLVNPLLEKVDKLMGLKEAANLKVKIPHLHPGVALLGSTQWEVAKVIKAMKGHLPLRVEAEPMSSMLALANKATKIANR
jgi:hypothetical protein